MMKFCFLVCFLARFLAMASLMLIGKMPQALAAEEDLLRPCAEILQFKPQPRLPPPPVEIPEVNLNRLLSAEDQAQLVQRVSLQLSHMSQAASAGLLSARYLIQEARKTSSEDSVLHMKRHKMLKKAISSLNVLYPYLISYLPFFENDLLPHLMNEEARENLDRIIEGFIRLHRIVSHPHFGLVLAHLHQPPLVLTSYDEVLLRDFYPKPIEISEEQILDEFGPPSLSLERPEPVAISKSNN